MKKPELTSKNLDLGFVSLADKPDLDNDGGGVNHPVLAACFSGGCEGCWCDWG